MRLKRTTLTVSGRTLPALHRRGLAVHRTVNRSGYLIRHLASGLPVAPTVWRTLREARGALEQLLELPVDWEAGEASVLEQSAPFMERILAITGQSRTS